MNLRHDGERVARVMRSQARWYAHARLDDYLVATCTVSASLPVVGRFVEPVGGLTTLGLWGTRYLPDFLAAARTRLDPAGGARRRHNRELAAGLMTDGLRHIVAPDMLGDPAPAAEPGPPWRHAQRHRRAVYRTSVRYGDAPGQLLDVWRRADLTGAAPVLLFVPGGAWVFGSRVLQGHALMAHLAERGWVCLSMQYRTSPRHRWPRQIMDVKAAVAWARARADEFGGDNGFVAVAGCSAGGHMAALVGLTPGERQWEAEIGPSADTSVDAVVSLYGRYDWQDRSTPERDRFMEFLERVVVKRRQADRPEVFRAASPVTRLHSAAPPFLVIHGDSDVIIPVAEARRFVQRLREVSTQPVGYVELPGAGHGFDLTDSVRTSASVRAIGVFLDHVYRNRPGTAATGAAVAAGV
ncbi:esterase/lipase [Mycolicibacterium chubuense NBB4]|uniref:Esterase/lipase n=1 Tax=Mycolicibacterium chubuense (strain NBB4) TaxID=710421 RepID=I4BIC6_MYCCN|nr:alpha/beta hydrolase [Mycolicibacterium chubuense]AFM17033.1 esterase/lipase [Mycolicibacterium chubuense NBB4]